MKLKTRLIISFFIIVFVPLILAGVVLLLVGTYQIRSLEQRFGIEDITYEDLSNNAQLFNKVTQELFEEIKKDASEDPEVFLDETFIAELDARLKGKYSYLVIRLNDEVTFSSGGQEVSSILERLPYTGYSTGPEGGTYFGGDIKSLVKKLDFELEDGSKGSVFLVTSVRIMLPKVKVLIWELFITVILILLLTSVILTTWIYRGIITPLHRLKVATQNITEGNLDFVLEIGGADEISELCTDFEEMRQRLKASATEKIEYDMENKELITNISHDLKTPITAVKGYVEGIMDGVADTPEKMDKYIKTIYNKANDMDRLINELTFYSKIDTNRIPYSFSKINVSSYFEDCIEEISLDLEAKHVDVAYFNYADEDIYVIADAEQLKRVINNIITNSVKYMDKKRGYINIRLKDVGDFIQVEIEDNGKGIGQKDLPYIFDRFYRTDTSRNSTKGGSGIGLSIVKKIIEDHGGKIWATSKESTGTVMHFVLRKYQEVSANE